MHFHIRLLQLSLYISLISSFPLSCYEPTPAFPVPSWSSKTTLTSLLSTLPNKLSTLVSRERYNTASYSIEITSSTSTIWSHYHTAREQNTTRPGDQNISGDSVYRIASISKLFTTLAVLLQVDKGTMQLDDPLTKYLPDLTGQIPWDEITLRTLASQLSGIPREFAQGDLLNHLHDPTSYGLPPPERENWNLPSCDEYAEYSRPCTPADLLQQLAQQEPLWPPRQKPTYGNVNFELLGLALEAVTKQNYSSHIEEAIFGPLSMTSSSLTAPGDSHAVLPVGWNYWSISEGVQDPTGGIYSSSADMAKFLRYVLTHYNALAGVNWLLPGSFSEGLQTFYGMPWEIFRSEGVLAESRRPVTFVTKSGTLPGYASRVSLVPEFGLGVVILTAGGDGIESRLREELQELVTVQLVRAAEEAVWQDVAQEYDGVYVSIDKKLDSSIKLVSSPSTGLMLRSFTSNGTNALEKVIGPNLVIDTSRPWRAQLTPTLLFKNEEEQKGEIWRIQGVYERDGKERGIWDAFCLTDVDVILYAGLPITEVVVWKEERRIEMPAWKLKLEFIDEREALVMQS